MSKISVDIEYIKEQLKNIGYEICDCIEKENNGKYWQLKFSNSGAVVSIYDSNKTKNTVVNGKVNDDEKKTLKTVVDSLKAKELIIDPLNFEIVQIIRSRKEDYFYDFKQIPHKNNEDMLHDILCLSNNIENRDAYLILGVTDDYSVVGLDKEWKSSNIFDFLRTQSFAGDHIPEIEVKDLYYTYIRIVVIKCKSSKYVPFYLTKKYRGINENQIYTRLGDTNTPKNESASYADIEKLWRIHFDRESE